MPTAYTQLSHQTVVKIVRIVPSEIEKEKRNRPGTTVIEANGIHHDFVVVHGITGSTLEEAVQRLADIISEATKDDIDFAHLQGVVKHLLARRTLVYDNKLHLLKVNSKRTPAKFKRLTGRRTPKSALAALDPDERDARMRSMMRHPSFGLSNPAPSPESNPAESVVYVPAEWSSLSPDASAEEALAEHPALSSANSD